MARPLPSSPVVRHRFLSSFLDGLNRLDRLLVFLVVVGVELGVGRSLGTDMAPPSNAHAAAVAVFDTLLLSSATDSSSGCRPSVDDSTLDRCAESLNAPPPPPPTWWAGDEDTPPPPWTGGDGEEACENVPRDPDAGDDRP